MSGNVFPGLRKSSTVITTKAIETNPNTSSFDKDEIIKKTAWSDIDDKFNKRKKLTKFNFKLFRRWNR